jgi:hypothetical protein
MRVSVQETALAQLRRKHPGLAERSRRSPAKAIRLFCLDCMGGSPGDVASCASQACPLHPFRMGVGFKLDLTDEQRAERAARADRLNAGRPPGVQGGRKPVVICGQGAPEAGSDGESDQGA